MQILFKFEKDIDIYNSYIQYNIQELERDDDEITFNIIQRTQERINKEKDKLFICRITERYNTLFKEYEKIDKKN